MIRIPALFFCITLALAGLARASEESSSEAKAIPEAIHVVTDGTVTIAGKRINYQATAGQLLMHNAEDKPIALYGYTAYTKTDGGSNRPVVFAYNGGPGSASMWLHMGILGPQRTVVDDPNFTTEGPFRYINNEFSILDVADLVMIDPVGTGYSRSVGEGKDEDFWGVDNDGKTVSDFIARWTTENNRWLSPKYILGESYGGMRSGSVALNLLNRHNLALNGVILVSPFMSYSAGSADAGYDQAFINYFSAYAATAWYHGVSEYRPDDLQTLLRTAEDFANTQYASALMAGDQLSTEQRSAITQEMQRLTGISADYWERANLRITESQFDQELLRQHGKSVGRIDARFVGNSINRVGEHSDYDPFFPAVGPAFVATFLDYYRRILGVETKMRYVTSAGLWSKWDYGHRPPGSGYKVAAADTGVDLRHAMIQNPHMRVLVQQGYYDLATPYGATQYFIDHMALPAELSGNITLKHYEAGHMMYIHQASMAPFKNDLATFITAP